MEFVGGKWGNRLAACVSVILFHIIFILLSVYLCFFRAEFLNDECEKYQVASLLGISGEELHRVVEELMLRVKGQNGDMDITVTVDGTGKPFFGQRDVEHIDDIAGMIKSGKVVCVFSTFGLVGLLFVLRSGDKVKMLCRAYLFSWLVWLLLSLVIGVWILYDLTGFINSFHRLFFNNDRWILNPAKDMLIWLFPTGLFRDAAVRLAVCLVAVHGVCTVVSLYFIKCTTTKRTPAHLR